MKKMNDLNITIKILLILYSLILFQNHDPVDFGS